ncbi:hypothetical protein KP509_22G031300 [Ceratopteris richardii]|uniref:Uncharacterized protein n=1 Tax=Ceratopteris richardii TaxID=49495 RepID=A0A8T2S5R9_CERRI|nr:hypothetical protein KP509_22G031300 [Ceratopteris richardii]
MGFTGAAFVNSISCWIGAALLAIYVGFSPKCVKTTVSLSFEAFQDLKTFFKLAVPSAAMICLEWCSYEILVILSGLLSNPELQTATISISCQVGV